MSCPICGAATLHRYRPFCSGRCADIDLGRWISGAYVIEGDAADDAVPAVPSDAEDDAPPRKT